MAEPTIPKRQHTVTKAILRRFVDRKSKRLEEFQFDSGRHELRKPKEVGFILNFIEHDAQRYEDRWKESEDKIDLIYKAFSKGTLHNDHEAIEAAKNLIALHAARSRTMR